MELKSRLDVNAEKRSSLSKECSELRSQMQPKRLEAARAAARSEAVAQAVDMISKQDIALQAQADHLRQMHSDLMRMRKTSSTYLEKHKQQLSG